MFNFFILLTDPKAIDVVRESYVKYAPYLSTSLFSDITFNEVTEEEIANADRIIAQEKKPAMSNSLRSIKDAIANTAQQQGLVAGSDEYMTFVFEELQKKSSELEDSRILDLYYFDEQANRFVWNNDLLSET